MYIELCQILREELSIASQVDIECLKILSLIKEHINDKSIPKEKISDGVTKKVFNFNVNLFGTTTYFQVTYYNFANNVVYKQEESSIEHNTGISSVIKGFAMVKLSCFGINGVLNKNALSNVLYHEVEHCYQFSKGEKQISIPSKTYDTARRYTLSENEYLAAASAIIYHSFTYEQDALVNGLYGFLKSDGKVAMLWDVFKRSEAYEVLNKIKDGIVFLSKCDEEERKIVEEAFDMSIEKIVSIGNSVYPRLENKIGKVLIKYRGDCLKENQSLFRLGYSMIL